MEGLIRKIRSAPARSEYKKLAKQLEVTAERLMAIGEMARVAGVGRRFGKDVQRAYNFVVKTCAAADEIAHGDYFTAERRSAEEAQAMYGGPGIHYPLQYLGLQDGVCHEELSKFHSHRLDPLELPGREICRMIAAIIRGGQDHYRDASKPVASIAERVDRLIGMVSSAS